MFETILLPREVRNELSMGPPAIRDWIAGSPPWVQLFDAGKLRRDLSLANLDPGEQGAIALALELNADLVLMDDREGVAAAGRKGLAVTGTLGVLALAAQPASLTYPRRSPGLSLRTFATNRPSWTRCLQKCLTPAGPETI